MSPSEVNGDRSTRTMTGAHGHPSVHRAVAAFVAAAVLAQNVACTSLPPRPDEQTCAEEKAEILSRSRDNAEHAVFFDVILDGQWRCAAFVPPGYYTAKVLVTWADGSTENLRVKRPGTKNADAIFFYASPKVQHSVLAHEVGVGRVTAVATLVVEEPSTTGASTDHLGNLLRECRNIPPPISLLVCIPAYAIATVVVIIALPFFVARKITEASEEPDPGRYIWVENNFGQTVTGIAPSLNLPAPPPSGPPP